MYPRVVYPTKPYYEKALSQNNYPARNDSKLGRESVKGAGHEAPFAFKSRRSGKNCQKSFISGSFQGLSHACETAPLRFQIIFIKKRRVKKYSQGDLQPLTDFVDYSQAHCVVGAVQDVADCGFGQACSGT